MTSTPYADAALSYLRAGWWPIYVADDGGKSGIPSGYTGTLGRRVTGGEVARWTREHPDANIAIRLPLDVIAIDVDAYGDKPGDATLTELEERLGALPSTWVATARPLPSGKQLFRVPMGTRLRSTMGAGIDVCQHHHRYVVVAPSVHHTGEPVIWVERDSGELHDSQPEPGDLPDLPWAWLEEFSVSGSAEVALAASSARVEEWIATGTGNLRPGWLGATLDRLRDAIDAGVSRHDSMLAALCSVAREVEAGAFDVGPALDALVDIWTRATAGEGRGGEFEDMLNWAVGQLDTASGREEVAAKRERLATPYSSEHEVIHATAADVVPPGEEPQTAPEGWEFVDLTTILEGHYEPIVPTIGARSDGECLIYSGRVHSISGEPGGGKTWLALHVAADVMRAGGAAAFIDYEDTPVSAVQRLQALGLDGATISGLFTYIHPTGPLMTRSGRVDAGTIARLEALNVELVIIDSVGESMALEGLKQNNDDEVTAWFNLLPRRLARATGAAIIGLDHVTKSKEDRGKWAIGSQRKLAGINGAAYGVEVKVAPTKTKDGKLAIYCAKDRHGTHQANSLVATVDIVSSGEGDGVSVAIQAPGGAFRPTFYMEQVSKFLEEQGEASGREIESGVDGGAKYIRAALEVLVDEKYVAKENAKRGFRYRLVTTFRDADPLESLTASTASHRVSANGDAVQGPVDNDRVHRVSDPLRSRGPAGTRSVALEGASTTASNPHRVSMIADIF